MQGLTVQSLNEHSAVNDNSSLGKNFRTAPYFNMHAHFINYAFYSLSLNTIDNYYLQHGVSFRAVLPSLSPSSPLSLPHFSGRQFLLSILPSRPLLVYFSFFLRYLQDSNSQSSIVFVRLAVYPLYRSTCAFCRSRVTFKIIFLIPYSNSKN